MKLTSKPVTKARGRDAGGGWLVAVCGVLVAAVLLGLVSGRAVAQLPPPAPPAPVPPPPVPPPVAAPARPSVPKPEADDPNLVVNGRKNVNTGYVKRLAEFRLTNDFLLERADRRLPEGITFEESEEIRETLAGAVRLITAVQGEWGLIDTYAGDVRAEYRALRTGAQAVGLWALLAAGANPEDGLVKKSVAKMLDLAMKGDGGFQRVVTDTPVGSACNPDPIRIQNPKSYDKLDTEELYCVIKALEALAHARLNRASAKAAAAAAAAEDYSGVLPMRQRTAAELRGALTQGEMQGVKLAVKALLFRQNDDGSWGSHVNDLVQDRSAVHYVIDGLKSAADLGAWVPTRDVMDKCLKYWLYDGEKASRKSRTHDLHFVPTSDKDSSGKVLLEDTAPPKMKADCIGWSGGNSRYSFNCLGTACGISSLLLIRSMKVGGSPTIRLAPKTFVMDQYVCEAMACMVRYLRPTGPNAETVRRPEELVADHSIGDPYATPYERVIDPNHGNYPGAGAIVMAQCGLYSGNDTFGHCEWMPVAVRAALARLEHVKNFQPAAVPAKESNEDKAERLKRLDEQRRSFGPERMKDMIFLSLVMDKMPVWKLAE